MPKLSEVVGATPKKTMKLSEVAGKPKKLSSVSGRVGLPGYERVEERIAGRPGMVGPFLEEAKRPRFSVGRFKKRPVQEVFGAAMKPGIETMKGIGLLAERLEAPLANMALKRQEDLENANLLGKTRAAAEIGLPPLAAWRYRKEIASGIKGERLGEIGDLLRRENIPEPIAAATGLLVMGALTDLVTGGGVSKIGRGVGRIRPEVMGKGYTLDRARKAVGYIDEARTTLGGNVKQAIAEAGDISVDVQKLSKELPKLPKTVMNYLDDPIYEVEKLADGSYKPTVANLHKMKDALADYMTTKSWEEASKKGQQVVKRAYGQLAQAMKDAAPRIKEPIAAYHNFMDVYIDVNKKLKTSTGTVVEKPLRGLFKPGAEQAYRQAWDDLSVYVPKLKQITKDMVKYTKRQVANRFYRKMTPWVAGGAVGAAGGGLFRIGRLLGD